MEERPSVPLFTARMPPVKAFRRNPPEERPVVPLLEVPEDAGIADVVASDGPVATALGGKARGLLRLARAGLPIPPTQVIPARVLADWCAELGSTDAAVLAEAPLPPRFVAHWVAAAHELAARSPRGVLAVRSSGVDEDGAHKSFAGVHHTALGVRPEDVPEAIRRVWLSAFSESAVAYRREGPAPRDGVQMAVVLQPMLEPECAGVVFTVNPQNGSWREMVVEVVRGQGDALVSGAAAPQYFVVRRPRELPLTDTLRDEATKQGVRKGLQRLWSAGRRVWNRVFLEVVHRDPVPQTIHWRIGSNGQLVRQPVPAGLADQSLLEDPQLLELCRLALRAEARLGEPLDIEFAREPGSRADGRDGRVVLLQARPITRTGTPRKRDVLWTRRFFGERWPTPPSTLSWSLLAPIIEWFIAYPEVQRRYLGGGPAIRLIRGRPYLNATVFRHLLFKWPGAPAPGFMLELIPPDEVDEWRRRFRVKADWAVYNAIFASTWRERRWRRFAFNPFTNHDAWEAFADRFEAERAALDTPILGSADALQRVRAQQELVRDYLSIHVCSLLFANLWYQVLEGCLSSWAPGGVEPWMEALAVCPPGNRTLETNQALHTLAKSLGRSGVEALRRGLDALEQEDRAEVEAFCAQFGHRAEASWEIFSPRWADHPEQLVPLLVGAVDAELSPIERVGDQERTFRSRQAEVLAHVRRRRRTDGPLMPLIRHWWLSGTLRHTRRYLLLRENQRFAFDRLLAGMQRTLVALGGHLVSDGVLDDASDIRWLTIDEVEGVVRRTYAADPEERDRLRSTVETRRSAHRAAMRDDPPIFLRESGGGPPVSADGELVGHRFQGLGVSPGRVRGRVRVLHTVRDGEAMVDGEILVTHAVDPGWTPLMLRAGAMVLELGSLLSHGAVVAREYDVPCVVNLSGVTRRLHDGDEVTVDGHRGLVWLH